ncbi:MAG: NnrU family protein [Terricaulis sp.]
MDSFTAALTAFVALHVGVSATGLRGRIVSRIGEGAYRSVFSVASLGLLVWLIQSYAAMRRDLFNPLNESLWAPIDAVRWIGEGIAFLGVALAVAGALTPGPTYAGFESTLKQDAPAKGLLRVTRHPFLWGVSLWSVGHLLVNGERFALMLFGALGVMALFGARSIDRKGRARNLEAWVRFEAATSNVPFAAIVQGRNSFDVSELGWRLAVGVALAVLVGIFHGDWLGSAP